MNFKDYLNESVSPKNMLSKMYKLQDLIDALSDNIMDYNDATDENPEKYPKLRNFKQYNAALKKYSSELENIKTQLRKQS